MGRYKSEGLEQNRKEALKKYRFEGQHRKTKAMNRELEGERFKSKIDPCKVGGRRGMTDLKLCITYGKWAHCRSAKMKGIISNLAMRLLVQAVGNDGRNGGFDRESCGMKWRH